ncbi:protein SET-like [Dipodomys merriami]|uniref:protein SET-like n=1 Tax=Dipodomys merriami TaxID=94247 RepID=UPI003855F265
MMKVEHKCNQLHQPCFQKRSELVAQISDLEITVCVNHPQMSELPEEGDQEALCDQTRAKVTECEDTKSGYRQLFLDENPYFENNDIAKEFHSECASCLGNAGTGQRLCCEEDGGFSPSRIGPYNFFAGLLTIMMLAPMRWEREVIKDDVGPNLWLYYLVPHTDDQEEGGEGVEGEGIRRY